MAFWNQEQVNSESHPIIPQSLRNAQDIRDTVLAVAGITGDFKGCNLVAAVEIAANAGCWVGPASMHRRSPHSPGLVGGLEHLRDIAGVVNFSIDAVSVHPGPYQPSDLPVEFQPITTYKPLPEKPNQIVYLFQPEHKISHAVAAHYQPEELQYCLESGFLPFAKVEIGYREKERPVIKPPTLSVGKRIKSFLSF